MRRGEPARALVVRPPGQHFGDLGERGRQVAGGEGGLGLGQQALEALGLGGGDAPLALAHLDPMAEVEQLGVVAELGGRRGQPLARAGEVAALERREHGARGLGERLLPAVAGALAGALDQARGRRVRPRRQARGDRLEPGGELLGRGRPLAGALGQGREQQRAQLGGHAPVGIGQVEGDRLEVEVSGDQRGEVVAADRVAAGHQLVEHHAEGVEVGARVDLGRGQLLGRGVARLAQVERGRRALALALEDLDDAEVDQLDQRLAVDGRG